VIKVEQAINKKEKIKYTVSIPTWYVSELKELASLEVIQSVNQGFQLAIELFINEKKKSIYLKKMQEAGIDKEFLKRTNNANNDFEDIDQEIEKSW
jgi:hypothetical protein